MSNNIVKTENIECKKTYSFMDIFKQFVFRNIGRDNIEDIPDNNFSEQTKHDNISLLKVECKNRPIEFKPINDHPKSIPKQDIIDLTSEVSEVIEFSDDLFDVQLDRDDDNISYHSSDFEFIDEGEAKKHGLHRKVDTPKDIKKHFDQGLCNANHIIPEGDEYLELFQGKYTPYPTQFMENKSTRVRSSMFVEYNGIGFNMHGPKQIVSDTLRNEAHLNANLIRQMYPAENTRRRRNYAR